MTFWGASAALVLGCALAAGCGPSIKRPYPPVPANQLVASLQERNAAVHSFRAESVMDYRVSGDRVKGTVLIAGTRGARIRFNAENPTGGSVAVDLACNGRDYQYLNYNENCQLSGPCSEQAIAQLLRVRLAPDEFMLLAIGGVPLLPHEKSTVEWRDSGRERITLTAADGRKQIIELSGDSSKRWDVLMAEQLDAHGKTDWKIQNKDFHAITDESGTTFRVPDKTLFEQPRAQADLLVRWKERELNPELADPMFEMTIPPGLPRCGQSSKH